VMPPDRTKAVLTKFRGAPAAVAATRQATIEVRVERAVQRVLDREATRRRQLRLAEDGGWRPSLGAGG